MPKATGMHLKADFTIVIQLLPRVLEIPDPAADVIDIGYHVLQGVAVISRANDHAFAGYRNDRVNLKASGCAPQKAFFIKIQAVALRADFIGGDGVEANHIDDVFLS